MEMLLIGDSIPHGAGCSSGAYTPHTRIQALRPAWRVDTYCRPGASVAGSYLGVGPMPPEAVQYLVYGGVVGVLIGTNDFNLGVALGTFSTAYATLIHKTGFKFGVRLPNQPIIITPIGRQVETNPTSGITLEQYRQAERDAATVEGWPVIEGPSLLSFDAALYADGTHPNDAGTAQLCQRLVDALGLLGFA